MIQEYHMHKINKIDKNDIRVNQNVTLSKKEEFRVVCAYFNF